MIDNFDDDEAASHVYFISPIGGGPVKIGYTLTNRRRNIGPRCRLQQMMVWSPQPLELLATMPGARLCEAFFHHRFRRYRMHGEWFRSEPDVIEAVTIISKTGKFPGAPNDPPPVFAPTENAP